MHLRDWSELRNDELHDPEIASAYLNEILESGDAMEIEQSIRYVLEANGSKVNSSMPEELIQLRQLGVGLNFRAI